MPSASFRHRTTAPVDAGTAWDRMQDADFWSTLGLEEITDEIHHPDGTLARFGFTVGVGGRRYTGTARTVEAHRAERMVVLVESRPLTGRLEVLLAPDGGGTSFDVSAGITARGMVATLAFGAISAALGNRFSGTVDRLAARLGG